MTPQHLSDISGYARMRTAEIQQAAAAHRLSHEAALSVAEGRRWYAGWRFWRRHAAAVVPFPASNQETSETRAA